MAKTAGIVLALLTAAAAGICWHAACGISAFARVDTGSPETHSEEDIREAVSIVRKQFRKLSGCIMTELHYCEERTQQELEEKRTCGFSSLGVDFDDVIVLESRFTTSRLFSEETFDGHTQDHWNWIITYTEADGWQFCTAGYA